MPFLKNTWYMFGYSSDVLEGLLAHKVIAEEPILVWRRPGGELAAIKDLCPHRFVPLHLGRQLGESIQCGYHGLRFGADGVCIHNPVAGAPIPKAAKVAAYTVVERYGLIWLWLGQACADQSLIPDFSFLLDPDRGHVRGYSHVEADYQLCVDNLSDLTHVQFLHEEYQASDAFERLKLSVRQEGDDVVTELVFPDGRPPAIFHNTVPDPEMRIDLCYETRWSAPSCVQLKVTGYPSGELGQSLFQALAAHILTPETERTSHYHYVNSRNFSIDDPTVDEHIRTWQRRGFDGEDKPMLEAQQRCIKDQDIMTLGPVLLGTDAGAIRVRRVLSAKMKSEGLPSAPADRTE